MSTISQRLIEDRQAQEKEQRHSAEHTAHGVQPVRASKRSASTDRLSSVGLSNSLLVGRITNSVNVTILPNTAPPTSHQSVAPARHAAMEDSSPKAAELACMIVARR